MPKMKNVSIIVSIFLSVLFLSVMPATAGVDGAATQIDRELWTWPAPAFSSDILKLSKKWNIALSAEQDKPELPFGKSVFRALPVLADILEEPAANLDPGPGDTAGEHQSLRQKEYNYLKKTLHKYADIQHSGGWPEIEPGATLRMGDKGPRIEVLRARLIITGDLSPETSAGSNIYDHALEMAIKRFQRRHGLNEDGIVGKNTFSVLNIPVEERIKQLQINLERWRSSPDNFGLRYLMVNIPGFELSIVENDTVVQKMRTIVGKKRRQTPVMSDRITYLELNPYWNIPRKIFLKDILPRIQEDPEFLAKQGIRVFDSWQQEASELDPVGIDWGLVSRGSFPYRLRQDPSEINSLGKVKFMFPNQKGVYIHDTPGKTLFNKQKRTFSSGCVRVQEPLALAEYLLKEQKWDRKKIKKTIASGQRQIIVLKKTIPVHLVYFTAWVDEDGDVNFREDIYDKDRQFLSDLNKESSTLTTSNNGGNDIMLAN
jgi:murein L,D-transpeptidase YcbB/YkuD